MRSTPPEVRTKSDAPPVISETLTDSMNLSDVDALKTETSKTKEEIVGTSSVKNEELQKPEVLPESVEKPEELKEETNEFKDNVFDAEAIDSKEINNDASEEKSNHDGKEDAEDVCDQGLEPFFNPSAGKVNHIEELAPVSNEKLSLGKNVFL